MNLDEINKIQFNFVVGKERSGTTLLQTMLNAHSNITAPPESRFIILLYFRYGKTKRWTEKIITDFCNDLFRERLFKNFWGIDKEELRATLLDSKDLLTFPLVCKLIFRLSSPEKKEVHVFFDKNPVYYYFLPELNKIFPQANYIHLVRDYRAYLVSYLRIFTDRKHTYSVKKETEIIYRWMKANMLIEEAKSHSPKKYLTLTYESLVSNPAQKMEEVCLFLNLPYDKNMAQNHQSGMYSKFNTNSTERFKQIHENVFQPINPALINNWKEKISTEELINVEAVAGKYAETKYGYGRDGTHTETSSAQVFVSTFIMNLKYRVIKALYRKVFANIWLYYKIKDSVWRNF